MASTVSDLSVVEELPKLCRYSADQLMIYIRLMDWEFSSQFEFFRSPVQLAIMRVVGGREAEVRKGTDASSIAASVGYARETVRRHLAWLVEHKWIRKSGHLYFLGPKILDLAVADGLDESIDRLLKAADQIRALRTDAESAVSGE